MHKGYGRRTGPIWVCSSDNGCSDGDHCTCGIQIIPERGRLIQSQWGFTMSNDKGSSVAIKVMDIDPEPLVLKWAQLLFSETWARRCGFRRQKIRWIENCLEAKKLPETQRMHSKRLIFIWVRNARAKEREGHNVKVNVTPEMKEAFYKKYKESPLYSEKCQNENRWIQNLEVDHSLNDQWETLAFTFVMLCNRAWAHRVPNLSNTSLEGAVCTFWCVLPWLCEQYEAVAIGWCGICRSETQNPCDGRRFLWATTLTLQSSTYQKSARHILVFENRRKGGMRVHLRFEYANKKYDRFSLEDNYYVSKILWNI